eukprot:CAMPEP_0113943800 /NCGR_PEP_ID=MMETSP1339-20121228/28027_1 /TAXON_ID=94617 /ORGANISM="Fibrocapsa japonica" /LENGTH=290 /DNA_ID=CAMNT_0000948763 /DNA_START=253 /DNA_END=1125 /DNA_ORIENTATION=- /assembly_acc=CAM_ASM_000762
MIRLKRHKIKASILFFGSARSKTREQYNEELASLQSKLEAASTEDEKQDVNVQLTRLQKCEWMIEFMDKVEQLSAKLTQWAISDGELAPEHLLSGASRYHFSQTPGGHPKRLPKAPQMSLTVIAQDEEAEDTTQSLVVCTGGGPGFMEAANKGAHSVPGSKNMGMGITLPFEDGLNPYVTDDLAFEFHYFFTRKYWMMYHCQALVCCPGGFGTLDELFEFLTLMQTGKVQKNLPIVLFGTKFWKNVVNWEALAEYGTVSQRDVDQLFFTDDVDEAFNYITEHLTVPDQQG